MSCCEVWCQALVRRWQLLNSLAAADDIKEEKPLKSGLMLASACLVMQDHSEQGLPELSRVVRPAQSGLNGDPQVILE